MISVVVPTYNHALAIKKCLDTVLKQTVKDIEVIVVDDGSTDNVKDVINNYLKSRPEENRVKFIQIAHGGAPIARNAGAKISHGEYIIFIDADLVLASDMFEKLLNSLVNNKNASYAYSNFRFGWKMFKSQPFNPETLKKQNYIHTSALIRREHFPFFDEAIKRFQDWDLWLTMLKNGHTGIFVPEMLFRARIVGNGISKWKPKIAYKIYNLSYKYLGFAPKWFIKHTESKNYIIQKHNLYA